MLGKRKGKIELKMILHYNYGYSMYFDLVGSLKGFTLTLPFRNEYMVEKVNAEWIFKFS